MAAQPFSSTSQWRCVRDFLILPDLASQTDIGEYGTSDINKALAG
jgi:hypothetical protein